MYKAKQRPDSWEEECGNCDGTGRVSSKDPDSFPTFTTLFTGKADCSYCNGTGSVTVDRPLGDW